MVIVGVKEDLQERVKSHLIEKGISVSIWYECNGDEEVIIVPPEIARDEGFVVEVEKE